MKMIIIPLIILQYIDNIYTSSSSERKHVFSHYTGWTRVEMFRLTLVLMAAQTPIEGGPIRFSSELQNIVFG